jgi:hypothetical protein
LIRLPTEIDFLSSFSAGLQWEPGLQWELVLQQELEPKLELMQEQEETSWMRTSKVFFFEVFRTLGIVSFKTSIIILFFLMKLY